METILLVEDDKAFRQTTKDILDTAGFIVVEAANGRRAIQIVREHKVDLILLDLRLPDGNGLDFILDIRRRTDAPIIIVSGESDKAEKMNGLDRGADDYVCKPFDMDELIARIRANLRRYETASSNEDAPAEYSKDATKIKLGDWTLDRVHFQVFDSDNRSADLTHGEFQLLDALVSNAGRPVMREMLCEAVREENYVPTQRSIDVKIARIRKKLQNKTGHTQFIKTIRGVGYMLVPQALDD